MGDLSGYEGVGGGGGGAGLLSHLSGHVGRDDDRHIMAKHSHDKVSPHRNFELAGGRTI